MQKHLRDHYSNIPFNFTAVTQIKTFSIINICFHLFLRIFCISSNIPIAHFVNIFFWLTIHILLTCFDFATDGHLSV